MGAEGWLAEECCHELVTIYLVHTPSHGPTPSVESLPLLELPRFRCWVFWNQSTCCAHTVQNASQCHFTIYWLQCDGRRVPVSCVVVMLHKNGNYTC